MSLRHITISLCLMLIAVVPLAAVSQASLLFLTFEPGARANGMARAYSAVADDAYAMWWNPGATAFNREGQLGLNHIPWLQGSGMDDMFYEYLGWNQYFDGIGNLNAHIVLLDAGSQDHTGEEGEYLGVFHTYEIAGAMGYSYDVIPEKLGIGANFKLFYSHLGPGTGHTENKGESFGFTFDIGAKAVDVANLEGLDLALVLQNFGPDVTYVDQEQADATPMTMRLGAAYRAFDNPMNSLVISAEASKILANKDPLFKRFITGWDYIDETIFAAGAEYTYLQLIALRAGYFLDNAGSIFGPSFGVGINYAFSERYKLSVDFAMVPAGEVVDFNKVFSIGFEY